MVVASTTITPAPSPSKEHLRIEIVGPFDFNAHRRFRQVFVDSSAREFTVDLGRSQYIDSSGLGMLLQLKEFAEARSGALKLVVPDECPVREMLRVAHFDQLMVIVSED